MKINVYLFLGNFIKITKKLKEKNVSRTTLKIIKILSVKLKGIILYYLLNNLNIYK